jgi:SEC-C motif-containing protein
MEPCPCGSGQTYAACCRPLIEEGQPAPTAEALMRARYTAHVKGAVDFVEDSTHPRKRGAVNRDQVLEWSKTAEWLGLEIMATEAGGPEDETGTVEFNARYRQKDKTIDHREIAEFVKKDGKWYFMDGKAPKTVQFVRQGPKVGRNDPCPCGSGKKFKKCCGA